MSQSHDQHHPNDALDRLIDRLAQFLLRLLPRVRSSWMREGGILIRKTIDELTGWVRFDIPSDREGRPIKAEIDAALAGFVLALSDRIDGTYDIVRSFPARECSGSCAFAVAPTVTVYPDAVVIDAPFPSQLDGGITIEKWDEIARAVSRSLHA